MKTYEGVFIFHQTVDDETFEKKIDKVRSEITGLGGAVSSTTRIGRNTFARPLKKKESGVFMLIVFAMEPDKIKTLTEHYRLNEDILRVQIVVAKKTPAQVPATRATQEQAGKKA